MVYVELEIIESKASLIGWRKSANNWLCAHLLIVVEWLERHDCDRHGLGSKPTLAILLRPLRRHFTALSPDWWSWQAVLKFIHISIKPKNQKKRNFNRTAIFRHHRKQSG